MAEISPYLHFEGNCQQAMTFYKECLGGELSVMTMGESPMSSQVPPAEKNKVMHSQLKSGSIQILASDMSGPGGLQKGSQVSLTLECANNKEADALYSKLSAGGKAVHPMKDEFFGYYGDLTDKFGMTWMINVMKPM